MGKTDFYAIIKGCRTNVRQPLRLYKESLITFLLEFYALKSHFYYMQNP